MHNIEASFLIARHVVQLSYYMSRTELLKNYKKKTYNRWYTLMTVLGFISCRFLFMDALVMFI